MSIVIRKIYLMLIVTVFVSGQSVYSDDILSYSVAPSEITFYHKDDKGNIFGNFANLRKWLKDQDKKLLFGMNGGMYLRDLSPQGLYIENGKQITNLNTTKEAYGNFFMQPNGIFFIDKEDKAHVVATRSFQDTQNIKHATQSGPMLVINNKIHPKFTPNSKHFHMRNGVGVLPDGKLLFAISKKPIRFYDFARFFQKNDCKNALYLDGFVSKMYLPKKNITKTDGVFGIIIAQIK